MQLGRYSVSTLLPPPVHSITFSPDGRFFAVAAEKGYEVWKTWPLGLVRRRVLPGTLALALILPHSPLLILQGGGASPLYAPNKVVVYNDKVGEAVAELEFGERIRGVSARRGLFCVALSRKVVIFEYGLSAHDSLGKGKGKAVEGEEDGFWIRKLGEWETAKNEQGLMALSTAPGSTLLALPGRQAGHVQLIPLPSCPSSSPDPPSPSRTTPNSTFRSPIILAHTHSLASLSTTPSGSHILTTSERGTLLRVWDTQRGRLERELRRGVDPAEMWGVSFEGDVGGKGRVVGWSDKGTIHVWGREESKEKLLSQHQPSLTSLLSRTLPLPKYFSSTTSSAQYHLPRKNPHAFSAALGAAGVPSMSMREAVELEANMGERFVVGWVEVDVPVVAEESLGVRFGETAKERDRDKEERQRRAVPNPALGTMGSGIPMGSRGERLSFGSDNTSRTATPSQRAATPTQANIKTRGRSVAPQIRLRGMSSHYTSASPHSTEKGKSKPGAGEGKVETKKEMQLVAITFSGDWYRLRIPDPAPSLSGPGSGAGRGDQEKAREEEKEKKESRKCELIEYRRLGVGGGGW
ncbi:hypothetical protein L202_07899 [Cryptococcus amylolentus CBS 6039]|uniref:Uncharacterized protein n=1 Tax=Cryptococcus amylolentus CBS 6039 TaxID=1295533 RepID=A0A1E3HAJ4_9TREE|nr:hypothetical protein L202_07899 [Cryptococcus amylolentus CBS 6039]ODN73359.1 hypothetical protein L202_07899 [Cryptococcus amylolentus CBS 6039]